MMKCHFINRTLGGHPKIISLGEEWFSFYPMFLFSNNFWMLRFGVLNICTIPTNSRPCHRLRTDPAKEKTHLVSLYLCWVHTNGLPLHPGVLQGSFSRFWKDMGVSKNRGTPKSWILIGFSIINHPFWGPPLFLEPPIWLPTNLQDLVPTKKKHLRVGDGDTYHGLKQPQPPSHTNQIVETG